MKREGEEDLSLFISAFFPEVVSKVRRLSSHSTVSIESSNSSGHSCLEEDCGVSIIEGNGCRHWTQREEVFLVGLVFDAYYKHGSLAPVKVNETKKDVCWDHIKKMFDRAVKRYANLQGNQTCHTRTRTALFKHFKVMKEKVSHTDISIDAEGDELPLFKKLYKCWEDDYNVGRVLTCSTRSFSKRMGDLYQVNNEIMANSANDAYLSAPQLRLD